MEKITYWLKKLGIMRTASYKIKGDAKKIVEMEATDCGMIQSQKEIDEEYTQKTGGKISKKSERKKSKILFWIFLFLALFIFVAYLGEGLSWGSFVMIILWAIFLFLIKKGKIGWTLSFVKVLVIGLALVVFSLFFVDSSDEEDKPIPKENNSVQSEVQQSLNQDNQNNDKEDISNQKCDDSNSEYADFNQIEKTIISINPCKVPWILAQPVENYELETKNGTTLKTTVFNNYVNNVKAGESYTIRVLDREEEITGQKEVETGIAIVRWTPNAQTLPEAKKEVKEIVENLEY